MNSHNDNNNPVFFVDKYSAFNFNYCPTRGCNNYLYHDDENGKAICFKCGYSRDSYKKGDGLADKIVDNVQKLCSLDNQDNSRIK
jgi:hypothetical protein